MLRILLATLFLGTSALAADMNPVEAQVAEAVKSEQVTVVHLWAPWCSNCKAELTSGDWARFVEANPNTKVIFVTVWQGEQGDGRTLLEANGLGKQPNFQFLVHPNTSRKRADKMTEFLGMPVTWIPTTWVYRAGTLRYALNYGEIRFDVLQTLVKDAAARW